MSELEKYEALFKEKLDSVEFPFDEENWKKAELAIIESRKKRRKPFVLWFSIVGALMLVLAGFILLNNNSKSSVSEENIITETKADQNLDDKLNINQKEKHEIIKQEKSLDENLNMKNGTSINNEISNDSPIASNPLPERVPEIKETQNEKFDEDSDKEQYVNGVKSQQTKNQKTQLASHNNLKNQNQKTNNQQSENFIAADVKTRVQKEQSGKSNKNSAYKLYQNVNASSNLKDSITLLKTASNFEVKNETIKDSLTIKTNSNESPEIKSADSLKKDTLLVKVEKVDSTGVLSGLNENEKDEVVVVKGTLTIEAGADYLLGWEHNGKNEASGINPVLGVTYSQLIKSNIGLLLGLQYNTISNLSNVTYSVSNARYDFGIEKEITDVSFKRLQYLSFPVKIVYKPNRNNMFGLGVNMGYLFNIKANITTYQISDLDSVNKLNYNEEKLNLKNNAFNAFDLRLAAFYRRRVYKKLNAGLEMMYGISDIKKNNVFKTEYFEKSIGIRFTLSYDLL